MPDMGGSKEDLSRYRIQRSWEDLSVAELLFKEKLYRIANNRSYYSIFHALRAVLILEGFDSGKHSGIIAEFRRRYIKENIFPAEMSKMIGSAFTIRNTSDYDDMFIASADETEEQIKNAHFVYEKVKAYLTEKGII